MKRNPSCLLILSAAVLAGPAWAGLEENGIEPEEPKSFCDIYEDFFDRATLYQSDTGFLRRFALTGRYHGQFFHNSQHVNAAPSSLSGLDDNDTDWFVRRFRLGFRAEFLDQFVFLADFNLDPTWRDQEPRFAEVSWGNPNANGRRRGEVGFFQNLFQVQLRWKLDGHTEFVVGKFEPDLTMEDAMPQTKLYTIEYSSLTEMVNHESTAGAKVELKDVWGNDVVLGVYNSGTEDDHRTYPNGYLAAQVSDLPQTNGDWGFQVKLSRDLWTAPEGVEASGAGLDKVRAGLWWFHAQDSKDAQTAGLDTNFEEFTDIVSFNTEFHAARWGVFTDFVFANVDTVKDDDTDLHGLVLIPYYNITSKWQLAYRYAQMWGGYAGEDRAAGRGLGVDLDSRLRTGSGMVEGDTLRSHYLGVNYFICGHKLKLQFGLEHNDLEDPRPGAAWGNADYWSYQSAIRMYF